ncbi:hypothetical protein G6F37_001954 [Rhizopus arrhizus]|nr:hypothetical protein G6F38_001263 [Rhizopus arrhizus]KAG1162650.1 hypothetical protein G6F37_001954 [Rhizopus arrhizus]
MPNSIIKDLNSQPKAQSAHNSNAEGNASTATNNTENHDDNTTIISCSEQNSNDMERGNDPSYSEGQKQRPKPKNTGGNAHHIAEHPLIGLGGLTGKQPVGEVNFKKL